MARLLVTGAAGFIGRALCGSLVARGHKVHARSRGPAPPIAGVELCPIGDIRPQTDWSGHLDGIEIVVHLATRAHRPASATPADDEAAAAAALARSAARARVRRLVHVSSVRAMGEATAAGMPFRRGDPELPRDSYGRAKLAIEHALQQAAREAGIELVILRPPLVYGPGVKANFRMLLRLVANGVPLPFAAIENRRSLIGLDNLVDLIASAGLHPDAAGGIFLARDDTDLSTPALIRAVAAAFDRPARLFAVPPRALAALLPLPGLGPLVARLTLSLQIDDADTRAALAWRPPVAAEIGLTQTVRAFREET